MTKVTMRPGRICLEGHAGYDSIGKDIVCAGVSTLVYTAIFAMKESDFYDFMEEKVEPGKVRISYQITEGREKEAGVQLDMLEKGLLLLSCRYPQNVQLNTAG